MTTIGTLGTGARFRVPGYADGATWEIISRARPSGIAKTGGKPVLTVKAVHVPAGVEDQNAFNTRYFETTTEVEVVGRPRKTVLAIDSRDQPEEIETIDQLARSEGVAVDGGE